jgi:hypothetical protein
MTDEAKYYNQIGDEFAEHGAVNHSAGQYVRGDAHTNTLENFYSVFKRGPARQATRRYACDDRHASLAARHR